MSAPETVRLKVDGVAIEVPKGTGLVEAAQAAGIEIPVFCYEPRLGAPVGACRMCLCMVEPGPPKPQAACTLTAQDGMIVRTALTSDLAAEAHLRQADPDLAADRARPRALHSLLPLHALQRRSRRRRPADRAQPRLAVADRDLRRRAISRTLQRERDRALPRRRADVDDLSVRGAPVGDPGRSDRLWHVPRGLQRQRDDARGEGQADPLPEPLRGRPGLALRQGTLRVCASDCGRPPP